MKKGVSGLILGGLPDGVRVSTKIDVVIPTATTFTEFLVSKVAVKVEVTRLETVYVVPRYTEFALPFFPQ